MACKITFTELDPLSAKTATGVTDNSMNVERGGGTTQEAVYLDKQASK